MDSDSLQVAWRVYRVGGEEPNDGPFMAQIDESGVEDKPETDQREVG